MKDVAASVRARLLYRLSRSPHAHDFVLKGAQLLVVHSAEPYRPTKDLVLLAFGSGDASDIAQVFREVSAVPVEPDGLVFNAGTVTAEAIRETARYAGVRVKLTATLERAFSQVPTDVQRRFLGVTVPHADAETAAVRRLELPAIRNLRAAQGKRPSSRSRPPRTGAHRPAAKRGRTRTGRRS